MDTKEKNELKDRFDLPELLSWIRATEIVGDYTDFVEGVFHF
ncbi:hypothetical protein [Helicobacter vulpis]|nr:hypothetical protein [Helicobacter vulpis]